MNKQVIAKAVSWEAISNAVCLALAYAVFGNFGDCLLFTGVCALVKVVLFYHHERFWLRWNVGRAEAAALSDTSNPRKRSRMFIEQPEDWDNECEEEENWAAEEYDRREAEGFYGF